MSADTITVLVIIIAGTLYFFHVSGIPQAIWRRVERIMGRHGGARSRRRGQSRQHAIQEQASQRPPANRPRPADPPRAADLPRAADTPRPVNPPRPAAPHRHAGPQPVPAGRENITETGPMVYFANDRHGNGDKVYKFNFKKVDGGWRAYILRTPSLRGRSANGGIIHRLHDDGGYYVCWDRKVDTLKDVQTISRIWADSIQGYIYTGTFG